MRLCPIPIRRMVQQNLEGALNDYEKISLETESDIRFSLWNSICLSAEILSSKCSVFTSKTPNQRYKIYKSAPMPEVKTWQLMEGICLLATLIKSEYVFTKDICNIFGKCGPIHFREDRSDRYLWVQTDLSGEVSSLGGRPDLTVTFNSEKTITIKYIEDNRV